MIEELKLNVDKLKRRSLYDINDPEDEGQNSSQEESKHQMMNDKSNF